jgi:hypothetical protein
LVGGDYEDASVAVEFAMRKITIPALLREL